MSARVILCLGSNIEPRMDYLDRAQAALCALPHTRFLASSETDETEPVDVPPEFEGQRFLNRILVIDTELSPMELSRLMHSIEDDLGRVRGALRNIPRTIDIDMIDYEGIIMDTPELTIPHPRAREREFVMMPLKRMGIDL